MDESTEQKVFLWVWWGGQAHGQMKIGDLADEDIGDLADDQRFCVWLSLILSVLVIVKRTDITRCVFPGFRMSPLSSSLFAFVLQFCLFIWMSDFQLKSCLFSVFNHPKRHLKVWQMYTLSLYETV